VGAPTVEAFLTGGQAAAEGLAGAAAPAGLEHLASVLDFGCGCGRVLSHLAELAPAARLTGVDVDAEAIAWARRELAGIDFGVSGRRPPLPFADGDFELVYSISVFSHLSVADQDAWLGELARVLAPGGLALLSTHGVSAYEAFRSGAVRTTWCEPGAFDHGPLPVGGFITIPYRSSRWSAGDLPGVGAGYGLSFHTAGYLREHWGRFLEVEAILPQAISGWQDLVVARKRA
jgi:SAM-dependent methyltransferase